MNLSITERPFILYDVGSADGLFDSFKRIKEKYPTHIHAFDPEVVGFKNNQDSKIFNSNFGLYKHTGKTFLYLTKKRQCSSMLKTNMELLSQYHNAQRFTIEKKIPIDVMPFVDYHQQKYPENPPNVDFIKLDTQGTEYEILEGMGKYLNTTSVIFTEAEFAPMYQDQKLFFDLCELLCPNFIIYKFAYFVSATPESWSHVVPDGYQKLLKGSLEGHSIKEIKSMLSSRPDIIFCDAVFVNKQQIDEERTKILLHFL